LFEKQKKIKRKTYDQFAEILLASHFMRSLPFNIQRVIKKWLSNPAIKAVFKNVYLSYSFMCSLCLQFLTHFIDGLTKLFHFLSKSWFALNSTLKIIGQKLFALIKTSCVLVSKLWWKLVYHFLLFGLMALIIAGWGIRLLAATFQRITESMLAMFKPLALSRKSP
jgi:hypothetical protein